MGILTAHFTDHLDVSFPLIGYGMGGPRPFHLGVPFFFVLTGFFLYSSYSRMRERGETVRGFLMNRYIRIAPSVYFFAVITILTLLVIGAITFDILLTKQFLVWMFSNTILFPVFNPDIFKHVGVGVINGSLWTVATQVSFFFFIPVIYLIEKRFGFRKMMAFVFITAIVGALVAWGAAMLPNEPILVKLYKVTFLPHLIFFGSGILLSKLKDRIPRSISLFLFCIGCVILLKSDVLGIHQYLGNLTELLWALPFSHAIIWFGLNGPKIFRAFNKFEDVGMGIYIWHMPVINVSLYLGMQHVGLFAKSSTLVFVSVIVATLIMAYTSSKFIEKPTLLLRKKVGKQPSVVSKPVTAN